MQRGYYLRQVPDDELEICLFTGKEWFVLETDGNRLGPWKGEPSHLRQLLITLTEGGSSGHKGCSAPDHPLAVENHSELCMCRDCMRLLNSYD